MNTEDDKNPGDDKRKSGKGRPEDEEPGDDKRKSETEKDTKGGRKSLFSRFGRKIKGKDSSVSQAAGPSGLCAKQGPSTDPGDTVSGNKIESPVKGSTKIVRDLLCKSLTKPTSFDSVSKDCSSSKKKKPKLKPRYVSGGIYSLPNPEDEISLRHLGPPPPYRPTPYRHTPNEDKSIEVVRERIAARTRSPSLADIVPEQSGSKSSLSSVLTSMKRSSEPAIQPFVVPRKPRSQSLTPAPINPEIYKEAMDYSGDEPTQSKPKSGNKSALRGLLGRKNRDLSRSLSSPSSTPSTSSMSTQKSSKNALRLSKISIFPSRQSEGNIDNPSASFSNVDECAREFRRLSPGKNRDQSPASEGASYRSQSSRDRNEGAARSVSRTTRGSSSGPRQFRSSSLPNQQQNLEIYDPERSTSSDRRSRSPHK